MSEITTGLTSGFTTAASDVMSAMGSIIAPALTILGAYIVIRMAIKTFKTSSK